MENGREFFLCYGRTTFGVRPHEQPVRSIGYRTATQAAYSTQARHTRAAQMFCLCRLSKSYGYRRYAPVIVLRGTVMPRLRRPKLDVAVRYPTLRIGGYNAERKILCRTLFFVAVSSLPLPPCPLREKGRFTRGWKTAGCLPSCAPAARSGTPRRGSRKNSPSE